MRVRQAHVGVSYFREAFLTKWGLERYKSLREPAVFFGIYKNQREKLLQHRSYAIAVWAGSDAAQITNKFAERLRCRNNIKHIAISSFISEDLKVHGIHHTVLPITPEDFTIFKPTKLGDCVYIYLPKKHHEFYGSKILAEIKAKMPKLKFIVGSVGTHQRNKLPSVYAKCFMGIRPTPHDGMSNTVIELGLTGRRCVWNGNAPNAIHFTDTNSIISAIKKEQKKIGTIDRDLSMKMSRFVDIDSSWLNFDLKEIRNIKPKDDRYVNIKKANTRLKRRLETKPNTAPKKSFMIRQLEKIEKESGPPLVSVIINTYNEDPVILRQAVNSYLNQKGVCIQLIISSIEDDPSWKLAKECGLDFANIPKPGIYQQLNNALDMVEGDWFAYASGNDIAKPNKLSNEIECCKANRKLVCYSDFIIVDHNLKQIKKRIFYPYSHDKHLQGNFVNDCALMHRSILDRFRPFNWQKWGNHAYYDFWLRVYEQLGDVFCYNASFEWFYRMSDTSSHVVRGKDQAKKLANKKLRNELILYHKRLKRV